MKIRLILTPNGLKPLDRESAEELNTYTVGSVYELDMRHIFCVGFRNNDDLEAEYEDDNQ